MTTTAGPPGPLPETGHELLDALLRHDFEGVEGLRAQSASVQARSGCTCGCGTLDLVVGDLDAPQSSASSPVPVEGEVYDERGEPVGGLLLFVHDGHLSSLEVYSYGQESLPLPPLDRVTWLERPPLD